MAGYRKGVKIMRIKVLLGSIHYNDRIYDVGELVDIPENEAKGIIKEGVAEKYVEKKPKTKRKKVETKKEAPKTKKKAKTEEVLPTIDWTLSELMEYAKAHNIKGEFKNKKAILKAIQKGGAKSDKTD